MVWTWHVNLTPHAFHPHYTLPTPPPPFPLAFCFEAGRQLGLTLQFPHFPLPHIPHHTLPACTFCTHTPKRKKEGRAMQNKKAGTFALPEAGDACLARLPENLSDLSPSILV